MRSQLSLSPRIDNDRLPNASSSACEVLGMATVAMTADEVKGLRQSLQELTTATLSVSALKATEDQTLLALVAVRAAAKTLPATAQDFGKWGVVVSTEFLGRTTFNDALDRFQEQGAWGTSVRIVPNCSLHSPSSTLSLALSAHGPNLGAGGGADGAHDAWLAAMGLLTINRVPGVWLVLTESSHASGKSQATAWALGHSSHQQAWGCLEFEFDPSVTDSEGSLSGGFEIETLLKMVGSQSPRQQCITWALAPGLRAHLTKRRLGNEWARAA